MDALLNRLPPAHRRVFRRAFDSPSMQTRTEASKALLQIEDQVIRKRIGLELDASFRRRLRPQDPAIRKEEEALRMLDEAERTLQMLQTLLEHATIQDEGPPPVVGRRTPPARNVRPPVTRARPSPPPPTVRQTRAQILANRARRNRLKA